MSEIGVIGQIYEDRRTKKKGKLIERDEKYKTLLLETSEGKSFNVSYGGFKSNWRSVDEHVETVEEAMEEIEIPEQPKKEKKEKKQNLSKVKVKSTGNIDDFKDLIDSYLKSFNSEKFSINVVSERGGKNKSPFITYKLGKSVLVTMYLRKNGYFRVIVPDFVYSQVKWSANITKVVSNNHTITFRLMCEDFGKFLEDIRPLIVEILSAKVEEE